MQAFAFKVQMYRSVIDSGWIEINRMTVLVGKNESGKTTLLKALHKFNPHSPEPYSIDNEWPRGRRKDRNTSQVVCSVRFSFTVEELEELAQITDVSLESPTVEISKDYKGDFEVQLPADLFPDRLHPSVIDRIFKSLPELLDPVGSAFREKAEAVAAETRRVAHEGRFGDFVNLKPEQAAALREVMSPADQNPQRQHEQSYLDDYLATIDQISISLSVEPSIRMRAHAFVLNRIPTFIYMTDYKAFTGSAQLDQVKSRQDHNLPTDEDKTLLMILGLSGLDLNEEVRKGADADREQRQYDLDDASATLTKDISERWRQKKYEVQFRADGHHFYTFVKDERDPALIRLEERSKGFQWFFSFDLMFMHESAGTFKGCVILLDEPGLHLHPDAQRDLLARLRTYAEDNTLLYTTHLPFMIDLQRPGDVRVLSETPNGPVVTENLNLGQPEAKFVLQAALGMSGSTSYLVAQRNLVVEGVDDFWILTELSGCCGTRPSPPPRRRSHYARRRRVRGGIYRHYHDRPKVGSRRTSRHGQLWRYGVEQAREGVAHEVPFYPQSRLPARRVYGAPGEFSIEDLFETDYYLEKVSEACKKQLASAGVNQPTLDGHGQLVKQVERACEALGFHYNKGSVAKLIRTELANMKTADELSVRTRDAAVAIFTKIRQAFKEDEVALRTVPPKAEKARKRKPS